MVTLGMSPMEAIVSATSGAAELLGLSDTVGALEPGRQADLLIVDGDPSRRIGVLRDRDRLVGVMQRGRIVSGEAAEG